MKFIDSFSKSDFVSNAEHVFFNKSGEEFNPNENLKEKVFGTFTKITLGNDAVQRKYFIVTHNNIPYDPSGIDSHRESTLNLRLKQVSQATFDSYVLYLKTRNPIYMTKAQRSFING